MNWNASATDWTKSSWRIVVMACFRWISRGKAIASNRGTRGRDLRGDFPTQNFTIASAREFLREVNDLRRLVGGEGLARKVEEIAGRDRAAFVRDHVRDHQALVGPRVLGDAGAVGHVRMALHHALDLVG